MRSRSLGIALKRNSMEEEITFEKVAYHEVGHAVMAWYTQIGFEKIIVDIDNSHKNGYYGKVVPIADIRNFLNSSNLTVKRISDYVLIFLSGMVSYQIKYPGNWPYIHFMNDINDAKNFCKKIIETAEFKQRTKLDNKPNVLGGVPYLYMNWLYGKSLMILQEKWDLVERAVELLHKRKEITYREFIALIPNSS